MLSDKNNVITALRASRNIIVHNVNVFSQIVMIIAIIVKQNYFMKLWRQILIEINEYIMYFSKK